MSVDAIEAPPKEGTAEFEAAVRAVQSSLARKFAWTAQHDGIIYREDPFSLKPMDDHTFNRVSRSGHSFRYVDSTGRTKIYFERFQDIVSALDDPSLDFGFTMAERVDFMPGQQAECFDDLGCKVLNLWQRPKWEERASDINPAIFLEHVRYLLDGDQAAIDHVLNFIAHLVQRPEQRVNHALLITSEAKGIGKSTLGTIIRRLTGERNSGVAQAKDLKSQFDGWLIGKLVVQIDEIYEYGNWDLANKLKPLITEGTVSVNVKYGPQMSVKNFARLVLFSNHSAPIDLEDGDRRYFVFDSQAQPRTTEYYDALNAFIESREGMEAIYWWLKRRDLSSFRPYAAPPMTKHKEAIIGTSGNPLLHYVREALESGHLFAMVGSEFTLDSLQRQLQTDGFGAQAKNLKELGKALKLAGIEQARTLINGERKRVYRLPSAEANPANVETAEF